MITYDQAKIRIVKGWAFLSLHSTTYMVSGKYALSDFLIGNAGFRCIHVKHVNEYRKK